MTSVISRSSKDINGEEYFCRLFGHFALGCLRLVPDQIEFKEDFGTKSPNIPIISQWSQNADRSRRTPLPKWILWGHLTDCRAIIWGVYAVCIWDFGRRISDEKMGLTNCQQLGVLLCCYQFISTIKLYTGPGLWNDFCMHYRACNEICLYVPDCRPDTLSVKYWLLTQTDCWGSGGPLDNVGLYGGLYNECWPTIYRYPGSKRCASPLLHSSTLL